MVPDGQPDETLHQPRPALAQGSHAVPFDAYEATRKLRAIAFVWVLVNVYLIASRLSLRGTISIGFAMAFVVVILSTWAALEGKRWGWLGMTLLASVSIADFTTASAIVIVQGWSDGLGGAGIARAVLQEFAWLGLGPAFGMAVVGIWFVSLAVLMSQSVRRHVFANKRRHLSPAQGIIGLCLMLAYLVGVIAVGATSRTIRTHGLTGWRSTASGGALDRLPPASHKLAQVAAKRAPHRALRLP